MSSWCVNLPPPSLRECAVDLEGIAEKLPQAFQLLLDEPHRKRLEYEFHSAGYHTIMEVITGFHTAIGHLINQVGGGGVCRMCMKPSNNVRTVYVMC